MADFFQSQIPNCRAKVKTDSQVTAQLRSNLDVSGAAALQTQELPSWLLLGQRLLKLVTIFTE